tara:strand:- start:76 stop:732 length:657 start_codon:yes stop_codon:yes gene_type:complete
MKKIIILFFIIIHQSLFANDNINKLNQLYLNGVLDKETYFISINKLGIDTTNEIFMNLFTLFSDKVLDIESYEKSLNNLINISNNNETVPTEADENSQLRISKNYIVDDCEGDSTMCEDAAVRSILNFKYENEEVLVNTKWLDDIVSSDQEIVNYMGLMFQRDKNSDDFRINVNLLHINGILIRIVFKGYFEKNDYFMTGMIVSANSSEVVNATLAEK